LRIPYYKVLMLICWPFAFSIFLLLFWISYKFHAKLKFLAVFESFLITMTMTFFFFQSSIVNALADLLNCTMIENSYYLSNYLFVKCEENNYNIWRNYMILPAFCFFSLILTVMPFIYMFKNRKYLYCERVLRKIAFLLNGYSAKNFFWYN